MKRRSPTLLADRVGFLEEVRDPQGTPAWTRRQTKKFACYFSYDPIWVIFYGSSTAAAIQTSSVPMSVSVVTTG